MNDGLLLTLGHGSSAILILDGEIVCGYQTERLTGIKGDSRFPSRAIEEIGKWFTIPDNVPLYISHWHPTGNVNNMSEKHYNANYIANKFPGSPMYYTGKDISHHDAHAFSALAYNFEMKKGSHIIVADGFGNLGEVLSIYKRVGDTVNIVKRIFGYNNSLGLLYQYATDYVGLKMNQDEWKLNAKSNSVDYEDIVPIAKLGEEVANDYIKAHLIPNVGNADDPVINLGALSHTHANIVEMLEKNFTPDQHAEIALFLQVIVESVITYWIEAYKMDDVTLVGGCFLNVELNGYVHSLLKGSISIMPLSGDEGAALGVYKYHNPEFVIPDDLCWGLRSFQDNGSDIDGLVFTDDVQTEVMNALQKNKIVNVVRGAMEFGPRAYCNTSTLALPLESNAKYINKLNNRDQDMPMCPVLTVQQGLYTFSGVERVIRSVEHMIIALEYDVLLGSQMGVAHRQLNGTMTGRPQMVDEDSWIYPICRELGPLINTSFNNHGSPICFSLKDVIRTHDYMVTNDVHERVVTIVEVESTPTTSEMH